MALVTARGDGETANGDGQNTNIAGPVHAGVGCSEGAGSTKFRLNCDFCINTKFVQFCSETIQNSKPSPVALRRCADPESGARDLSAAVLHRDLIVPRRGQRLRHGETHVPRLDGAHHDIRIAVDGQFGRHLRQLRGADPRKPVSQRHHAERMGGGRARTHMARPRCQHVVAGTRILAYK